MECCILMVELALRCFDHMRDLESSTPKHGFWDSHYALVQKTDQRFVMLQAHLNAKSLREDPIAFSLYMNLRATEIAFHEAAIAQAQKQGLPMMMAAESQRRSMLAAGKIANAVRLNYPTQRAERDIFMLQATFIAWPLVMAMKALSLQLLAPPAQAQAQRRDQDQALNGVELSLRLLLSALDCVEDAGGYWHSSVAAVARILQEWDEKNGAFDMTL
ncbi:hypothetical protein SLS62_000854 [Diatrype stigma]|uniref:Uncharacterized protein n=1 Tax=Diatrype stigma TaxID=117547 RepID=A0AAN9VA14_9PEZI